MSATVELDDRAFQRALRQYVSWNRRDMALLINNKSKDLMFRAASAKSPVIPKARKAAISGIAKNWALRAFLARRAGATTPAQIGVVSQKIINGRMSSIGFMRSAFVKAGHQIRGTNEARPGREAPVAMVRNPHSQANTVTARPGAKPTVIYSLNWKTQPDSDAAQQRILDSGMRKAIRIVERDMIKYVHDKMAKQAKRVGLAVGRAVLR